jgi:hypothetical protein
VISPGSSFKYKKAKGKSHLSGLLSAQTTPIELA